ncbi:UNVERIFIED_CONTAM: hypothetical protein FKN15_055652 [Acipenser sinensis]
MSWVGKSVSLEEGETPLQERIDPEGPQTPKPSKKLSLTVFITKPTDIPVEAETEGWNPSTEAPDSSLESETEGQCSLKACLKNNRCTNYTNYK